MKKLRRVFLIVFAVSALALALVACSEAAIPKHDHQWSEWSVDTATCTQGGTQTRTCTRDGCNTQDGKPATQTRTTAALGHNVTSWTLSETDAGKHEGVCTRTGCGVTVTEAHHANEAGTECVDCGAALGGSEQCLHPNASATSETAATCTSAKIEHWTCPDCVWTEDRPVGTPLGHDYINVAWKTVAGGTHERECARGCGDKQTGTCDSNGVITGSAATCTAAGREDGTKCSVCGGNEKEGAVINALGHDEFKKSEAAATCTADKVEHWACHRCDWTNDKEIVDTALGHDYTDVAWKAVAGGTHERACARGCGDKQTENCDSEVVITGTAATCLTAGRADGSKCSVCGGNEKEGAVINALGHNVTSWTLCETDHSKHEGVCEREGCGEIIKKNHHSNAEGTECDVCHTRLEGGVVPCEHPSKYHTDAPATCTTNQVEHWYCPDCVWTEDKEIAATALGHDYADVAWTAADGGTHERVCARGCGDKQTEACNHDTVVAGTAATCLTAGREDGTKCSVCGGNEVLGAVINALGHDMSVASTTSATCTAAQINHMECSRCGYTEDQTEGEALGHDYTDVAWTAADGGTHERACARGCGDKQTEACNHDTVVAGTAATCLTAGREDGTKCSVCGGNEVLGAVINALGHEWGEWSADTATCTEGGTQTHYCERVGCDTNNGQRAEETRTTDALGHDEYKADETAATCTADKVEHWACHRCDWTDNKEIAETALGHDYADVAWTAADGGTHERACARGCGDKQTEACNHDTVVAGTAATCLTAGREDGTKCSVCGGNEVLGAVINALGHDMSVASTTSATCTAAQINHMECSRCGYTEDQTVGIALGHDYAGGGWTAVDDGTHHAQHCSRCDALDLDNKHPAEWDKYGLTEDEAQHYQVCKHCDIHSAPADHSVATYTYAGNGTHSGECVCGKSVTEACTIEGGSNACSACGRIVGMCGEMGATKEIVFSTNSANVDGFKVEFSSDTVYNEGIRLYAKGKMTITAPKGAVMTKIVFNVNGGSKYGLQSSSTVGYDANTLTWTGESNEVVFVNSNGSQARFTKIVITYNNKYECYHDNAVVACSQRAPSCEGTGILQDCYRCQNCGLYFTTDACTAILEGAIVPATGHTYGEWIAEVAATCVATGTKGHYHCDVCGGNFDSEANKYAVLDDLTIAINPDNHSRLSEVKAQDPTCDNAGWYAHYKCDGCGKKYETTDATEVYDPAIAALGHDLAYRANGDDKHEQYCTRGDYVGVAAEHIATDWVAETDGHHQVCIVCGLEFNESEHAYTDGKCVCGMEEAHEHNYTETVTKEPTCTEKGVKTFACDSCADTYTEDIDALGHDFAGDVLPIVGDDAHHAQQCSRCDAFDDDNKQACDYTENTVDADGHHMACVCGRIGSTTPHEYAAATQTCACGKINPAYLVVVGEDMTYVLDFTGGFDSDDKGSSSYSGSNSYVRDGVTFTTQNFNNNNKSWKLIKAGSASGNATQTASITISAVTGAVNTIKITTPVLSISSATLTIKKDGAAVETITLNSNLSAVAGLTFNIANPTAGCTYEIEFSFSKPSKNGDALQIEKVELIAAGQDHVADPDQTPSVTAADCMNAGKVSFYCTTAGCTTLHEVAIPTLAHTYGEWTDEVAPTCVAEGTKGHYHCEACGNDFDSEENEYALLDSLTIAIDPNSHVGDLTHVAAQTATTCNTTDAEHAGHVEYWQCACGVMYADANRNTVIESLEFIYLDHTPEWTNKTDSGHAGECNVCNTVIAEQQHVWNEADTECTICGYVKPAGKHYITTVIVVDGVRVDGIPAGVALTWDPADTNGAFDAEDTVTLEISLRGYNLVSVAWADSTGNETEDWMEVDGAYMGEMNDDYTLTITLVSIPTAVVNYSVDNATVTVTDSNGTTISSGDSVLVGTELTITVTADQGYEVKSVTVNGTAVANGKYLVAETDTTITIAATVEEKAAVYKKITTQEEFDNLFANSENAKILIVYGNQFVDITSAGTNTAALAGTATIENDIIASTADVDKYAFTVEKSGNVYKFKSYSGYYMGHSGTSNNLTSATDGSAVAYNNIVVVDADGTTHIVQGDTYTSKTSYEFMFNSSGSYCRYYKGTQKSFTLYVLQ